MPDFSVPSTCPTLPVKEFLRRQAGISLTLWRKIKYNGTLKINALPAAVHDLVYPGDTISVTWPEDSTITAENLPLAIAYEDEWLLAADKPAGMLVHPAAGKQSGTLANAVMHYYRLQNYSCGFHPVNRLDRNTSGLVLIAKRPDIQHWLNQNQQQLSKTYLAIASGIPHPDKDIIDAPIGRKPGSIIEREVSLDGQQAITHYRVLTTFNNISLLEIILETGRTHQIRVHLSHIGCPLLGDDLYGGPTNLIHRQALHAAKLSLPHPITKKNIDITSPLPGDLTDLLSQLGD
ncbi:RluA family pseudouridine synthase [Sporomusa sp.]|uniref:RluA family pseudouridine synthase n=1 Tax=Sporomusa sp. TaxID=2078658 RepID=UPI002BDC6B65|nr:RluA family pseudouridine synthase [Sporomusa sp.]HWR41928.1 RluA family pseudouridine synthase [Sporomusa sp.]